MDIRQITREEIPAFLKLAQYSFGTYEDKEPEKERIERFDVDGTIAAFDGPTLASQLAVHRFEQSVRGTILKMGGIGAVGTVPEYRGRGLVRKLFAASFAWMHEQEMPVSMLRPFKEAYYEKFGYVRTAHSVRLELPNRTFHDYRGASDGVSIERLPASEAQEIYFNALRSSFAHVHGRVLGEPLSPKSFAARFKDRLFLFARRGTDIVAMLTYRKEGFLDEGKLLVSDFFWTDLEALHALFGFFAIHRDQIGTVTINLPYDTNVTALFPRIAEPVKLHFNAAPWMVRIIDARATLDGLRLDGPSGDGEQCTIRVDDPMCEWNRPTLVLAARNGRLTATETSREPDIVLPVQALSALVYGSFPIGQIAAEFPFPRADPPAMETLGRWFPPRTVFNDYWF